MKCFLKGAAGAACLLLLAAAVIPQYSDYRARAETDQMLIRLGAVQRVIEDDALKRGILAGTASQLAQTLPVPDGMILFQVSDTGTIIAKGMRNGQMLILSPSLINGRVEWRCIGAPDRDMPRQCRGVTP